MKPAAHGLFLIPVCLCVLFMPSAWAQDELREISPTAATKYYRAECTLAFVSGWGTHGKGDGLLAGPSDIAWAGDRTIYICQSPELSLYSRVQQFTEGGVFIRWFGGWQGGFGQNHYLRAPKGIAISPDTSVWLTQTIGNEIKEYSAQGEWLRHWSAPGVFYSTPYRIAVSPERQIVFSDYWNGIVYGFTEKGKKVWEFMESTGNPYKKYKPESMAIGADGRIYLADNTAFKMLILDKSGKQIGSWGRDGRDPGNFIFIAKVCVGPDGDVYVLDRKHDEEIYRIQRFTANGALVNVSNLAIPPNGVRCGNSFTIADDGTFYLLEYDWTTPFVRVAAYRPGTFGTAGNLGKILGRVKGLDTAQMARTTVRLEAVINGVKVYASVRPKANQVFTFTRFPVGVPFTLRLFGHDVSRYTCAPLQGMGAPKSAGNDLVAAKR